jgi:hypothetical protein
MGPPQVAAPTQPKEEPALGVEPPSAPLPKAPAIETPKEAEKALKSPTTAALGIQELRDLRATAGRMSSGRERDQNLLAIAQQATRQKEYRLAIEIAGDIAIGLNARAGAEVCRMSRALSLRRSSYCRGRSQCYGIRVYPRGDVSRDRRPRSRRKCIVGRRV